MNLVDRLSGAGRKMRRSSIFHLALIGALGLAQARCTRQSATDPLAHVMDCRGIDESGELVLSSGYTCRLAGITIKPIVNRVRPNWAVQVSEIIGKAVEVEKTGDRTALVYYRQLQGRESCASAPLYGADVYARASLNKLLIRLGIARFDPTDDSISDEFRSSLRKSQLAYDKAVSAGRPAYRDLAYLAANPVFLDEDWFCGPIHVSLWDATIHALEKKCESTARARDSPGSATPGAPAAR